MLINASDPEEFRVAIVEDGRLEEFALEVASREQLKGNIYKGVISNIEPSLQAAFIHYGSERQGFLPISEIHPEYFQQEAPSSGRPRIQEVLRKGQEVLVQVIKEEIASKGAYLTTYISLPGRFLVLLPGQDQVGISRKIEEEARRQELKEIIKEFKLPQGVGLIVRTASATAKKKDLQKDYQYLYNIWEEIKKNAGQSPAPSLIYKELDLVIRTIRDYYISEINEILIDDTDTFNQIKGFFKAFSPKHTKALKLYKEKRPIFSKYQIEEQLERLYDNHVPLKSGGGIVINATEALVAIDVNSGRCISPKDIEFTAFKTNLEAAQEIARQLRLRDLGGLIVIDFIDMKDRKHRKEVERELKAALKKEKARVTLGQISKFGLLELSRQRLRSGVATSLYVSCPHCQGRGVIKSAEASGLSLLRRICHEAAKNEIQEVRACLSQDVTNYLLNKKRKELVSLEEKFNLRLFIEAQPGLTGADSKVEFVKRQLDAEKTKAVLQGLIEERIKDQKGLFHAE
ncbi:MAG: Rne/Rng family ribonuclease [Deltaproteobacteria bacterium]|nr:Rne/Rng family ribonuclease [Deltaproteobacteria bacterium]